MRVILMLLLIAPLLVLAASPRGEVMAHDCKQANAMNLGFICHLHPKNGLWLEHVEKFSNLPPDKKEKARYEYNRLLLNYHSLGGREVRVTEKGWPPGRMNVCTVRPKSGLVCVKAQCRQDGTQCVEMNHQ